MTANKYRSYFLFDCNDLLLIVLLYFCTDVTDKHLIIKKKQRERFAQKNPETRVQ